MRGHPPRAEGRHMATALMRPRRPVGDAQPVRPPRRGDEDAFGELVERYGALMFRVASMYVRTPSHAEEIVQETWLAVLEGIDRFEGRASLKTWLFRILTNRAKTRGEREARCLPFCACGG